VACTGCAHGTWDRLGRNICRILKQYRTSRLTRPNSDVLLLPVYAHAQFRRSSSVSVSRSLFASNGVSEGRIGTKAILLGALSQTYYGVLNFKINPLCLRARGSVVASGIMLKAGRSRVQFPTRSLDFN
jgi:hypothetical protein